MLKRAWRVFDHRADLGLDIEGLDSADLFRNAAHALFSQITDRRRVRVCRTIDIRVQGMDWEDLMVNWLRELLYLFNGQALVIRAVRIEQLEPFRLFARVQAEAFDPRRHIVKKEVKAATYHRLSVEKADTGWRARVIFDV